MVLFIILLFACFVVLPVSLILLQVRIQRSRYYSLDYTSCRTLTTPQSASMQRHSEVFVSALGLQAISSIF